MTKIEINYLDGNKEEFIIDEQFDGIYFVKDNWLNFFYTKDNKKYEKYINMLNTKEFDIHET